MRIYGCLAGVPTAQYSGYLDTAMMSLPLTVLDSKQSQYLKDVDRDDPLAHPARADDLLTQLPAWLLITSTHDLALSSVAFTHARLCTDGKGSATSSF
jgi:hypothetical protein